MQSICKERFPAVLILSVMLIVFVLGCDNPVVSDSGVGGSDNDGGDSSGITGPWALSVSGTSQRTVFESVTTDTDGNIYAVGLQDGSDAVSYGNGVSTIGPQSGFNENAVVVKYNANGEAQWARTPVSAPNRSVFLAVAVDHNGNVYAAGYQAGDGEFDYGNGVTVASAANVTFPGNMVVVKYDSAGVAQWARTVTSVSSNQTSANLNSRFNAIAVDPQGNVYVAGRIGDGEYGLSKDGEDSVTVSPGGVGSPDWHSVIIKYSPSGTPQWANSVNIGFSTSGGNARDSEFNAIVVSNMGKVYAAGYQRNNHTYTYGETPDGESVQIEGIGLRHMTIVQYDSDGNIINARTLDGRVSNTVFHGLAAGNDGTIYAAGYQQRDGEYTYGPGVSVAGSAGSPSVVRNAVLVAYNSDLEPQWARSTTEGEVQSEFYSVAIEENGVVHVVGYKLDTDSLSFAEGITVEGSSTEENALIVSFSTDGTVQSARTTIAGQGDTVFRGVVTVNGDLVVVGQQRSTHTYDYGEGLEATGSASAWPNAVIVNY